MKNELAETIRKAIKDGWEIRFFVDSPAHKAMDVYTISSRRLNGDGRQEGNSYHLDGDIAGHGCHPFEFYMIRAVQHVTGTLNEN